MQNRMEICEIELITWSKTLKFQRIKCLSLETFDFFFVSINVFQWLLTQFWIDFENGSTVHLWGPLKFPHLSRKKNIGSPMVLASLRQARRKVWNFGGARSTVVVTICPPGWDRVNCLAKKRGGG